MITHLKLIDKIRTESLEILKDELEYTGFCRCEFKSHNVNYVNFH